LHNSVKRKASGNRRIGNVNRKKLFLTVQSAAPVAEFHLIAPSSCGGRASG
jgi:hypothetical protein